ncbi:MAG: YihY/virulence factor BrkB family protein, partial [Mycetocola sp.]
MNTSATSLEPTVKTPWTEKGVVLSLRQRNRAIDFALTGIDRFRRHKTGRNAALMAHYGFLSVFPLLAVMTTILGFVLQDDPELQQSIVDSAFANLPIIGAEIKSNPSEIEGSFLVLILGLATSLWAGTRCFASTQDAMNDIWEIPEDDRPRLASKRGRALLAILVVGLAQVASGLVSGIIGVGNVSWLNRSALTVAAIVINIVTLMLAYRILTARRLNRRQMLPGAVFAGLMFSLLQVVGGALVSRSLKNATSVYGSFAAV